MKKLIFPLKYIGITQGYKSSHKAIDLGWSSSYGGPNHIIYAPEDGKVTYVKNAYKSTTTSKTYGNYVKIDHGDKIVTLFAHLKYNSICVKVGDYVKKGQKIGMMGNTGYSFGTHLHYEVIINNKKQNPLEYTYYTSDNVIGKTTKSKYKPMKLESEVSKLDNSNELKKDENLTEVDDTIFEYICTKSGMYKIYLNENEKLIIKD